MRSEGKGITVAAGALGAIVFLALFGAKVLSPAFTGFLTAGDPGQHYYGWLLFREAPWQKFIGMMNTADYPYSVSVVYTDSIPLCAVFFKLFRNILPPEFQYFGLWAFFSFIMQGVMAERILERYVKNPFQRLLDCVFFISTPAFVKREFWHIALASHWILLSALYCFISDTDTEDRNGNPKRKAMILIRWACLGVLCAFVHLYFLGICGLAAVFSGIRIWYEGKGKRLAVLVPVSFVLASLPALWILGVFSSGMAFGAPGTGYYNFNLLGFLIHDGWSYFCPDIPFYSYGQFEGFTYLGLGFLILFAVSIVLFIRGKLWKKPLWGIGAGLCFASIIIAVSTEVSAGPWLLWKYDIRGAGIIKSLLEMFRSSGRFAWILLYMVMIGVFSVFGRSNANRRKKLFLALTAICLVVQIVDLLPGLKKRHAEVTHISEQVELLSSKIWGNLAESGRYRHLVIMDKDSLMQEELYAFAEYAALNHMTINDFYFARSFDLHTKEIAEDSAAHPSEDTIYIFPLSYANTLANYDLTFYAYEGYFIGLKESDDQWVQNLSKKD